MLNFKIGIIFNIFFISFSSYTQILEFGVGAGVTNFKGDISPKFNPMQIGFGANGLFRYNFSKSVSFRAQLMYGSYNAEDQNTNDAFFIYRNKNVNGTILEGSVLADYNFLNKSTRINVKDWTPYLFGGIGVASVVNKSDSKNISRFTAPVITYGLGVKYRFKGSFNVCAEFGSRFTFSDDFDFRYSGTNLNVGTFGNTNPASSGSILNDKISFGDLSRKDQYFFTNLTLTYTIFNIVCPD